MDTTAASAQPWCPHVYERPSERPCRRSRGVRMSMNAPPNSSPLSSCARLQAPPTIRTEPHSGGLKQAAHTIVQCQRCASTYSASLRGAAAERIAKLARPGEASSCWARYPPHQTTLTPPSKLCHRSLQRPAGEQVRCKEWSLSLKPAHTTRWMLKSQTCRPSRVQGACRASGTHRHMHRCQPPQSRMPTPPCSRAPQSPKPRSKLACAPPEATSRRLGPVRTASSALTAKQICTARCHAARAAAGAAH